MQNDAKCMWKAANVFAMTFSCKGLRKLQRGLVCKGKLVVAEALPKLKGKRKDFQPGFITAVWTDLNFLWSVVPLCSTAFPPTRFSDRDLLLIAVQALLAPACGILLLAVQWLRVFAIHRCDAELLGWCLFKSAPAKVGGNHFQGKLHSRLLLMLGKEIKGDCFFLWFVCHHLFVILRFCSFDMFCIGNVRARRASANRTS